MNRRVETASALLACVCLGGIGAQLDQTGVADSVESVFPVDVSAIFRKYESWFCSFLGTSLIGLCGIFPLLIIPIEAGPSLKHGGPAQTLRLLLSFAVGSLLGDVFLHLLPEAWEHLQQDPAKGQNGHLLIGVWVLVGILTFVVLEKLFPGSEEDELSNTKKFDSQNTKGSTTTSRPCNGDVVANGNHFPVPSMRNKVKVSQKSVEVERHNGYVNGICSNNNNHVKKSLASSNTRYQSNIHISGYLNLLANCIDNFAHGLAVAGSFLVSRKVGVLTTFAILIHEIPHEIGDFAILLKSGFNRWEAGKAQIITAAVGMLGAITALSAESSQVLGDIALWILPFTAGGFLNIALVNVLPDLLKEKNTKESFKQLLSMLAGIAIMAFVTYICS